MSKDYYKCECGKEFDNPQKFNGHKSHCKIHQLIKWGSLEHLEKRDKIFKKAASDINEIKKEESIRKKNIELISWLSSLPKCERCGKIMTQRFSCGRFCSRECANTRNH